MECRSPQEMFKLSSFSLSNLKFMIELPHLWPRFIALSNRMDWQQSVCKMHVEIHLLQASAVAASATHPTCGYQQSGVSNGKKELNV